MVGTLLLVLEFSPELENSHNKDKTALCVQISRYRYSYRYVVDFELLPLTELARRLLNPLAVFSLCL